MSIVSQRFVITGTDTGLGKTTFAAMLMLALTKKKKPAGYWKPVQSGVQGGVDTKTVQRLTELPAEQFLQERYILTEPLSPHRSAELDGVEIDPADLIIPDYDGPLLIEGAGGLMVPLTRETLLIDVMAVWNLPVILCARTALGTINHTLLSVEALKKRKIPILGLAFIGEDNPDNICTIHEFTGVPVLGRMPVLEKLNPETLLNAFEESFSLSSFIHPERSAA